MIDVHLLLALEEEVVDELMLPVPVDVAVEAAYPGVEEIEVQHGYVGPGAECRTELEDYLRREMLETRLEKCIRRRGRQS